jgi:hypothetical protein
MAFVEDTSIFFADFGEVCTLAGASVRAIFDSQTVDAFGDVITQEPSALLPTSSVPAAAAGQAFTRGGITYTVRAVRAEPPDGAFTRLALARA